METRTLSLGAIERASLLKGEFINILAREQSLGFEKDNAFKVPEISMCMRGEIVEISFDITDSGLEARVYIPYDIPEFNGFKKKVYTGQRDKSQDPNESSFEVPCLVSPPIHIEKSGDLSMALHDIEAYKREAEEHVKESKVDTSNTNLLRLVPNDGDEIRWVLTKYPYVTKCLAVGAASGALAGFFMLPPSRIESGLNAIKGLINIPDAISEIVHGCAVLQLDGNNADQVSARLITGLTFLVVGAVAGTLGGLWMKKKHSDS